MKRKYNMHYPSYFDTSNLPLTELEAAKTTAISQEKFILELFKLSPRWTACKISYAASKMPKMPNILFTSARRSLTVLANKGIIKKTDKQYKTPYGGKEFEYILIKESV